MKIGGGGGGGGGGRGVAMESLLNSIPPEIIRKPSEGIEIISSLNLVKIRTKFFKARYF